MINAAAQMSLRDAMYAMSLAKAVPDAELLDEFARRYPNHANALTEFAIELAIDSLMHRNDEEDFPADTDTISPIVSRVMSQFENQLYERRQARGDPARAGRDDFRCESFRRPRSARISQARVTARCQ
ncbi:MAG: hypothetical protein ABS54_10165 [Hyphomicrobium sp. SCN 65-11]|nr:MAG: hypothetical protein ABS54_10165 [Hyphomicrobium sp. SCN 65-11]